MNLELSIKTGQEAYRRLNNKCSTLSLVNLVYQTAI
jgi:hypothetical protein